MPEFFYTAADAVGKKVEGKLEASNEGELRMVLRGKGLRPVKISKASLSQIDIKTVFRDSLGFGGTVSAEKLMNFIRQLHVMITSGVPMVQAIDLFYEQETDPMLKIILGSAKEKIKAGSFLWEVFAGYPKVFEKVFVSLVRAGEGSGTLEIMLKRVGKYLENSFRLKRLIKSSMTYPIVVLSIAFGVITLMLTMVIPKFEEMLTSGGNKMPAATQFVIDLSHWVRNNFLYLTVSAVVGSYLIGWYFKTDEGKVVKQKILLGLPLFGDLIKKSGVAKFARTLSTLLASGVPLVDSLEICRTASEHIAFEDAVGEIKREIENGGSVSVAMSRQSVFPRMAVQMTSVGENTGNMDKMLERVADFYEEEVETAVQGMMKLIEPFMLVFLGGIVGGLMIAMYLPMFSMANSGE